MVDQTIACATLSRNRTKFAWPIAGMVIGTLVGITPLQRVITLPTGIAAWCVDMVLVLVLSAHPIGARVGVLMAGLLVAVPCFVQASPLSRFLLMCFMGVP